MVAAVALQAAAESASRDQRQADRFSRDGYAVVRNFLDVSELAAVRNEVERHVSAPRDASCVRPHNTLLALRWSDGIVRCVLRSEPRMHALRAAVGGDDLRWISGYVSIKEPHSEPLWWHQDWWCWDHPVSFRRAAVQVAVLCYLTDTDSHSGALRLLPGSHRRSSPVHASLPEAHTDGASLPSSHPAVRDQADQVTLAVRAGDAVVVDYRLLHGTHANRRPSRRDCVLLSFTPSWRDLPRDVRGHLISHPALPAGDETPTEAWAATLLPTFAGARRDLPLNRVPPPEFAID